MAETKFKGKKISLRGELPQIGSMAKSFELLDQSFKTVTLESFGKKKKILNIFISLDTPVCSQSIRSFQSHVKSIPDLVVLNISMDLPFAAARFCKQENIDNVITLSAFRSSFPLDYGVEVAEGALKGLCARAVFVLGEDNRILYKELVSEITQEPNYNAALNV
jgi:thiol peroxidase